MQMESSQLKRIDFDPSEPKKFTVTSGECIWIVCLCIMWCSFAPEGALIRASNEYAYVRTYLTLLFSWTCLLSLWSWRVADCLLVLSTPVVPSSRTSPLAHALYFQCDYFQWSDAGTWISSQQREKQWWSIPCKSFLESFTSSVVWLYPILMNAKVVGIWNYHFVENNVIEQKGSFVSILK